MARLLLDRLSGEREAKGSRAQANLGAAGGAGEGTAASERVRRCPTYFAAKISKTGGNVSANPATRRINATPKARAKLTSRPRHR